MTPTTGENILVGPSSEPIEGREDVSTDKLTLDNIKAQANLIVSNIPYKNVIRTFAGLRPSCSKHDFIIEKENEDFIFLKPSLVINLTEIDLLNQDHLTFKNG